MRAISGNSARLPNGKCDTLGHRKFSKADLTDSIEDVKRLTAAANGGTLPQGEIAETVANDGWFARACELLFGRGSRSKAGTALWALTGWDERSCQRYVAGTYKPPALFLVALLRSPQGWTWLCAAMEGADVPWFAELKQAKRVYDVIKSV